MNSKVIFIDIDGTICTEERTFERPLAKPFPLAKESVNKMYDAGHTIIFWTARGWEQYRVTKYWLDTHKFKYHQLFMGKPIASIFIDDRAKKFMGWHKNYLSEDHETIKRIFIIAEAGVNHNGDISVAKKLIDAAVAADADAVKFQTFKTEHVMCKSAPKAEYQKITAGAQTQFEMVKKLELSYDDFRELKIYCDKKEIMFLSSPFDRESIDFLANLGVEIIKIPSGEITNLPYLRAVGSLKKRAILSSGMSTLEEIGQAIEVLVQAGTKRENITILHCNTEYPTPLSDVNLRAMHTIKKSFGLPVGYSDHSEGILVPIVAVSMGAQVIEKHFTLDKSLPGPDHQASLEPKELKEMVEKIRMTEQCMGSSQKHPTDSEKKNIVIARKSIVATKNIKKGEIFSEQNITTKRPGDGISPMKWDSIMGTVAKKDYKHDEKI